MTTTRPRVILVAAALAAAAGLGACKKESKKGDDKRDRPEVKDEPVTSDLRQVLALLPNDSDMIVGLDIASLREAEFYKAYQSQLEELAGKQLALIRDACGFDPVLKMSKVVVAGKGTRRKGDLTAVAKGLGRAETMGCLAKPFPDVRVTVDGDYALVEQLEAEKADGDKDASDDKAKRPGVKTAEDKQAQGAPAVPDDDSTAGPVGVRPDPNKRRPMPPPNPPDAGAGGAPDTDNAPVVKDSLSLLFIDDTTVVIARRSGKGVDKPTMQQIVTLAPDASVTASPNFMQMLDAIDTDAKLWFVINGAADSLKDSPISFLSFKAAFGHVQVSSGVTIDASLRLESDAKAAELAKRATDQIARLRKSRLKSALGVVTFESEYNDVRVHVEQTRPQMDALIEQIALYLPFL